MNHKAKQIVKKILKDKKITYKELSNLMFKKDYIYSENTIRSKINRGTFSFIFLLEVCDSLELDSISLESFLN